MNLHFSRNQLSIFFFSLLLMIGLYVLVYFAWIKPADLKLSETEQELKSEQLLLAKTQQPVQTDKGNTGTSDIVQKQLPVKPLMDEYMLEIIKAEGISGVVLRNITLQDTPQTTGNNTNTSNANTSSANGNSGGNQAAQSNTQSNTNNTNNTTQKTTSTPVPITLNIEVQYNVYEQLQSFIKELEGLQRITYVQGISFQGRDEIVEPNMKTKPYNCILQVKIYYMPSMKDLEQSAPSIQLPPLCKNRTNPVEPQQCK
ncbi:hypothetical protein [Ectobacillus polymachus]|uniref:hypothetical protein n=1 Tax=Ectobacillus polymachus TaxID=1508806 RepID=UPI003A86BCC0